MTPKKQNPLVDLDAKAVGAVLRCARENLRYSYRELSAKCGVSATQLLRLESGEFEYSMAKLFRVCLSLGLAVGDVLEFATVRNFGLSEDQLWDEEDVTRALVFGQNNGLGEASCKSRILAFVTLLFQQVASALTAANGEEYSRCIGLELPADYDDDKFGGAMVPLLVLPNVERLLTLRALLKHPYQKLRSLGLVNYDDLTHAIYNESIKEFHQPVPASVRDTLRVAEPSFQIALKESQSALDKLSSSAEKKPVVNASMSVGQLVLRAARVTEKRGLRVRLASALGVTRQAVNNWFSGTAMPDGEKTLKLLQWVEAAEANQKHGAAGASTPAAPKAQSKDQKHDAKPKRSSRRK